MYKLIENAVDSRCENIYGNTFSKIKEVSNEIN